VCIAQPRKITHLHIHTRIINEEGNRKAPHKYEFPSSYDEPNQKSLDTKDLSSDREVIHTYIILKDSIPCKGEAAAPPEP